MACIVLTRLQRFSELLAFEKRCIEDLDRKSDNKVLLEIIQKRGEAQKWVITWFFFYLLWSILTLIKKVKIVKNLELFSQRGLQLSPEGCFFLKGTVKKSSVSIYTPTQNMCYFGNNLILRWYMYLVRNLIPLLHHHCRAVLPHLRELHALLIFSDLYVKSVEKSNDAWIFSELISS